MDAGAALLELLKGKASKPGSVPFPYKYVQGDSRETPSSAPGSERRGGRASSGGAARGSASSSGESKAHERELAASKPTYQAGKGRVYSLEELLGLQATALVAPPAISESNRLKNATYQGIGILKFSLCERSQIKPKGGGRKRGTVYRGGRGYHHQSRDDATFGGMGPRPQPAVKSTGKKSLDDETFGAAVTSLDIEAGAAGQAGATDIVKMYLQMAASWRREVDARGAGDSVNGRARHRKGAASGGGGRGEVAFAGGLGGPSVAAGGLSLMDLAATTRKFDSRLDQEGLRRGVARPEDRRAGQAEGAGGGMGSAATEEASALSRLEGLIEEGGGGGGGGGDGGAERGDGGPPEVLQGGGRDPEEGSVEAGRGRPQAEEEETPAWAEATAPGGGGQATHTGVTDPGFASGLGAVPTWETSDMGNGGAGVGGAAWGRGEPPSAARQEQLAAAAARAQEEAARARQSEQARLQHYQAMHATAGGVGAATAQSPGAQARLQQRSALLSMLRSPAGTGSPAGSPGPGVPSQYGARGPATPPQPTRPSARGSSGGAASLLALVGGGGGRGRAAAAPGPRAGAQWPPQHPAPVGHGRVLGFGSPQGGRPPMAPYAQAGAGSLPGPHYGNIYPYGAPPQGPGGPVAIPMHGGGGLPPGAGGPPMQAYGRPPPGWQPQGTPGGLPVSAALPAGSAGAGSAGSFPVVPGMAASTSWGGQGAPRPAGAWAGTRGSGR